ncbi:hypothetical protein JTE90_019931 [Oedothorax gibbosus]|uniref:HMG box domain-containing protein n=1 Tax=Oedothorax gibbosus TaxID=931172 RepID=A0AAV6UQU1_9ARAC|nr:hypothetical protein JTE90_019931 [Oedothorax gibbosus]
MILEQMVEVALWIGHSIMRYLREDNSSEPEQNTHEKDVLTNVRRPMNAFFIFCKRHRDIVREKYPHLENRCITKILGEWWASLEPVEKASYTSLAKQYKDAFMKAHPDFKWYKLPDPPARTLVTRPSNSRFSQNEINSSDAKNCGITLGKLVDDEQLGGLSSLINTATSVQLSTSIDSNNHQDHMMAEKGESLLKPPKKRYIINGEFQSAMDTSSDDTQVLKTRDACTALLELAEICSSKFAQEMSSMVSWPNSSGSTADMNHIDNCPDIKSFVNSSSLQTVSNINTSGSLSLLSEDEQEQPLDLCKNKEKVEVSNGSSKTITTSHQQLIDHFVDKFLCDKPALPNHFYKSEIIDPALCKLFSEKSVSVPSSKDSQIANSAFTLSIAIESAVDKAYSRDFSNSYTSKVSDSNVVLESLSSSKNSNSNLNKQFLEENINHVKNSDLKNNLKLNQWPLSFSQDYKKNKTVNKLIPATSNDLLPHIKQNLTNLSFNNSIACNSSNYFDKLIVPPKKSSVWCNIFMSEQQNNSQHNNQSQDDLLTELPLSSRRNSQRSCKGKRYQALLTEGLLQFPKERKQNCPKRFPMPQNNEKNGINSINETNFINSPKKKKKETCNKNKSSTEAYGIGTNIFNLEEKIASLPKCNFENLSKKKNLETTIDNLEQKKESDSTTVHENTSANAESLLTSASGRYRTGNFDLEEHIAFLPKCNIETLSKRKKKD